MNVNPSYQKPVNPELPDLLQRLRDQVKKEMFCVRVGVIVSFDPATQSAHVHLAQQQVTAVAPDGTRQVADYPELLDVPVVFPAGGGYTLTFPIAAGDECLVFFCDRQIDNWYRNGPGNPPSIPRMHDISDGFCLVGVRSNPRALAGVSTTTTQLRSDDASTLVEVDGSGVVRVVAPVKVRFETPLIEVTGILNVLNENSEPVPCAINGDIVTNGDVIADGISLNSHHHTGVQPGGGNTGGPV